MEFVEQNGLQSPGAGVGLGVGLGVGVGVGAGVEQSKLGHSSLLALSPVHLDPSTLQGVATWLALMV